MSITITKQPSKYHSAYNPIKFELDSTNKNKSGFRYIVEIYDSGTTNKLAEFDVAPDPFNSGKADIDVSRIVQNKVDSFVTFTSNAVQHAENTYYNYDIKFGESYNSDWNFNDFVFLSGGVGLTTDTFYGSGFTDATHSFIVGSQIFVQMDSVYGDNRDLLNGYWVVTDVPSNKIIQINIDFNQIGSGPISSGVVRFSDFQKARTYDLASVLAITAVNVAQDIIEYSSINGSLNTYVLTGSTSQLLTNAPDKFFATPEQTMFLNMLEANDSGYLYFENSNGDVFRKSNAGDFKVKSSGVGPGNLGSLSAISGSTPLIKNNTAYYDLWVTDSGATQTSEKLRIYLDKRCVISDVEIMFMDRKGSFMSFAFQNRRYENVATEKQTYRQYVRNYKTHSKGMTSYHSKYSKTLTLNTNFMGEDMNLYFEELLTSRHTYVKWEGVWYACIVEDGTYQNEFERNNKLIKKNVTVRFAIDSPVN